MWLDVYNNGGTPVHSVPNNSQYKCYDGMHNWNQVQPAPYDGYYTFPSVTAVDPVSGKWTGTNCTALRAESRHHRSIPLRHRPCCRPASMWWK